MAVVRRPPPTRTPRPQFHTFSAGKRLVRIFNPQPFNTTATTFRFFGPLERFDHQRRQDNKAGIDSERGIYYAAETLSCCIVEIFGDSRVVECGNYHVAMPKLIRDIRLLDLRGNSAMRAGTLSAVTSVPSRRLTQRWSRYFYENSVYESCDGVIYHNAHNGEEAIALYERTQNALRCQPSDITKLDDPGLRLYLIEIAERSNLVFLSGRG